MTDQEIAEQRIADLMAGMWTVEIENEIAELMGEDWIDAVICNGWKQQNPDLDDHAHCGIVEGWCRDRGIHLHYWSRGWDVVQVVEHDQHLVYIAKPHKEALLEGVRLAAEVEND